MSQRGNKLLREVMALSLKDRQALVEEVLSSIDDDTFKKELLRRRNEYLMDKSSSVPWKAIFEDDKAESR